MGEAGIGVKLPADRRDKAVLPGRGQQGYTERAPVVMERGGHRKAAQIEQVDEIRIGAEARIEPDRSARTSSTV